MSYKPQFLFTKDKDINVKVDGNNNNINVENSDDQKKSSQSEVKVQLLGSVEHSCFFTKRQQLKPVVNNRKMQMGSRTTEGDEMYIRDPYGFNEDLDKEQRDEEVLDNTVEEVMQSSSPVQVAKELAVVKSFTGKEPLGLDVNEVVFPIDLRNYLAFCQGFIAHVNHSYLDRFGEDQPGNTGDFKFTPSDLLVYFFVVFLNAVKKNAILSGDYASSVPDIGINQELPIPAVIARYIRGIGPVWDRGCKALLQLSLDLNYEVTNLGIGGPRVANVLNSGQHERYQGGPTTDTFISWMEPSTTQDVEWIKAGDKPIGPLTFEAYWETRLLSNNNEILRRITGFLEEKFQCFDYAQVTDLPTVAQWSVDEKGNRRQEAPIKRAGHSDLFSQVVTDVKVQRMFHDSSPYFVSCYKPYVDATIEPVAQFANLTTRQQPSAVPVSNGNSIQLNPDDLLFELILLTTMAGRTITTMDYETKHLTGADENTEMVECNYRLIDPLFQNNTNTFASQGLQAQASFYNEKITPEDRVTTLRMVRTLGLLNTCLIFDKALRCSVFSMFKPTELGLPISLWNTPIDVETRTRINNIGKALMGRDGKYNVYLPAVRLSLIKNAIEEYTLSTSNDEPKQFFSNEYNITGTEQSEDYIVYNGDQLLDPASAALYLADVSGLQRKVPWKIISCQFTIASMVETFEMNQAMRAPEFCYDGTQAVGCANASFKSEEKFIMQETRDPNPAIQIEYEPYKIIATAAPFPIKGEAFTPCYIAPVNSALRLDGVNPDPNRMTKFCFIKYFQNVQYGMEKNWVKLMRTFEKGGSFTNDVLAIKQRHSDPVNIDGVIIETEYDLDCGLLAYVKQVAASLLQATATTADYFFKGEGSFIDVTKDVAEVVINAGQIFKGKKSMDVGAFSEPINKSMESFSSTWTVPPQKEMIKKNPVRQLHNVKYMSGSVIIKDQKKIRKQKQKQIKKTKKKVTPKKQNTKPKNKPQIKPKIAKTKPIAQRNHKLAQGLKKTNKKTSK